MLINPKRVKFRPFMMREPDLTPEFLEDVRKHGVKVPIVLCGLTLIDGLLRLAAAKKLGIKMIPCRKIKRCDH